MANNSKSVDSLEHPFEDIGMQETCAKFQQNSLNFMVVGAQFFRHIAVSKFFCGILHYLICITKLLKKISPCKPILY